MLAPPDPPSPPRAYIKTSSLQLYVLRRGIEPTSRHRAYVEASSLDTLRNWIMESLYEHRGCVEVRRG